MFKKSFFAPIFCLPLLACGGDDGGTHVTTHDASNGSGSGSGSGSGNVTCTAAATYAPAFTGSGDEVGENLPAVTTGSADAQHGHIEFYDGVINGSGDVLDLSFYAKNGGFGSGDIATGTYALSGDDIDFTSCGICAALLPQNLTGSGALDFSDAYLMTKQYMAASGSITLSSVTGTIAGTLSNVQFKHINLDSNLDNQSYPDACSSTITTASFSATLQQGSAAFVGTTDNGQAVKIHLRNRHF